MLWYLNGEQDDSECVLNRNREGILLQCVAVHYSALQHVAVRIQPQ